MRPPRRSQIAAVAALMSMGSAAGWVRAEEGGPSQPEERVSAPEAALESPVLSVAGTLTRLLRRAAWPRLEMQTDRGESWMLELPPTVTLAWYQGHPTDLDALKPGEGIKVLYTKVRGKKRVKSVQLLAPPGAALGGATAEERGSPFDALPKPPPLPVPPMVPLKTPTIPAAPAVPLTGRAPEAPEMPAIPSIDTSRHSR
ncbi:MAG: hypothetical protein HY598_00330 [Candidatus Omnitrophica bacterium]|nr:hypothetical protein [Candidatus Omnitrophota bacterium]